jgi:hypothetical protein
MPFLTLAELLRITQGSVAAVNRGHFRCMETGRHQELTGMYKKCRVSSGAVYQVFSQMLQMKAETLF